MPAELVDILFVEDNPDHAELVLRHLEAHPLAKDIRHLHDGEAALDYLFRRGEYRDPAKSPRPHVVLLDLRLPKVDGLEVLRQIRQSQDLNKIAVVILTTSRAEVDVGKAYGFHANSYLVKPIDFQEFTDLINDLSVYWFGMNQWPP